MPAFSTTSTPLPNPPPSGLPQDVYDAYVECLQSQCDQNEILVTAQQILMGLIGVYGVVRQVEALEDQVALQERVVSQADEYLNLATRNYEEVVLRTFEDVTLPAYENIAQPAFDCQKDLFDRYDADMRQYEIGFLADTIKLPCEYAPDYETAQGRAMSVVDAQFDRAARNRARTRGKYATGQCCHEAIYFSVEKAKAKARAANEGYRYEDALKREMDRWYFTRRATGAELAAAARAHVISGVNGGVAGVNASLSAISAGVNSATSGIAGIGSAVGRSQTAVQGLSAAIGQQGSFFGNLSNGAFQSLGYSLGFGGGNQNGSLALLGSAGTSSINSFGGFQNPGPFAPFEPSSSGFTSGFNTAPTYSGGGNFTGVI